MRVCVSVCVWSLGRGGLDIEMLAASAQLADDAEAVGLMETTQGIQRQERKRTKDGTWTLWHTLRLGKGGGARIGV